MHVYMPIHVQGKGIFLVRELQQVLERLEVDEKSSKPATRPPARIVQRSVWASSDDINGQPVLVTCFIGTSVTLCCYEVENLTFVCTCCWWPVALGPGWCSTGRAMSDCAVRPISWVRQILGCTWPTSTSRKRTLYTSKSRRTQYVICSIGVQWNLSIVDTTGPRD